MKSGFFLTSIGKYCLLSKNYSFFTNSANKTLKTHFNNQGGGEGKIKFSSQYIPVNLNINLACLSVCLYPINVKTAEPIGPKFFVGHHVTTGKVFLNPQNFFFFVLKCEQKEHVHNLKNNGREAPYKPIVDYIPIATNLNRILVSIIR